jgi:hypothetical protein
VVALFVEDNEDTEGVKKPQTLDYQSDNQAFSFLKNGKILRGIKN